MREVIWSPEAKNDFESNIDYLLLEWTEKEAQKFIDDVFDVLYLLQKSNVEFQKIGYSNIHVAKVCAQVALLYRVNNNQVVELVRFWDVRQNPDKLNGILELQPKK